MKKFLNNFKNIKFLAVLALILLNTPLKIFAEDIALLVGEDFSVFSETVKGIYKVPGISLREFYMHGTSDQESSIVSAINSLQPKCSIVLGSKAASLMKKNLPNLPFVYALVVNTQDKTLLTNNTCGIGIEVSPRFQMQFLKRIAPLVKSVGVIYNPTNSSNFISEARLVCNDLGINLVAKEAFSKAEVASAIGTLEGKIDAFWFIADPVVLDTVIFEKLLMITLSNKIPLICPSKNFVDRGGLFSLVLDYDDVGKQLAETALEIASGNKSPAQIGLQFSRKFRIILNQKIADRIGLNIPASIIKEAAEIIR